MSARKIALVAAMAALGLATAYAADTPAAPDTGATAASMPQDCGKPMARHDHGAERGTPTPAMTMMTKCPMAGEEAASPAAPVKKAKAKRGHDHARVHKLM